jgi:AbrB family looped-hinge helix DNA binding protein
MPTAMVTFNGRITLPPEVRKELGLKTGDNVDFVEVEKGRFAIRHQHSSDQTIQNELDSTLARLCVDAPVQ